jgi:hypothetical protein
MITSIVRDLYNEVLLVENNIVEQEKRQYEESLNEEVKSL